MSDQRWPQCRSWDEAEQHIEALQSQIAELQRELRCVTEQLDTLGSPIWKRVGFRIQGWPPWYIVAEHPTPRFWHTWTWHPWFRWSLPAVELGPTDFLVDS